MDFRSWIGVCSGIARAASPRVALLFLVPVAIVGCVTEPITGRSHLALISESDANALGVQAYSQVLSEARVTGDPAVNDPVIRVARRIADVTDARMVLEGREPYTWEFVVIDDAETINAFALPGGKVAVYTGILPVARDEGGLAVVIGHEVAHAYAQHGRKRISEGIVAELGMEIVAASLEGNVSPEVQALILAGIGIGYALGIELPFSRDDESAADEIGLMLMAEAGYDPREATGFWERMEAAGGEGPPEFLSTHPSPDSRIDRIRELLPGAIQVYERTAPGSIR